MHGHDRVEADLTLEEREAVRDFEAWAWGSIDVSEEEARARLEVLTPRGRERVQAVMLARVKASRERQRVFEERVERLDELQEP